MTDTSTTPGGIVVGTDGSDNAAEAVRWAKLEADVRGLPLTAVMAWDYLDQRHADGRQDFDPGYSEADARAALDAALDAALGDDSGGVQRLAECEKPAKALLDAGANAELIVVGARGLGGFKGLLLGSTSQHVLHHSSRPVAVVRHDSASRFDATNRVAVGVDGSPEAVHALRWAVNEARARNAALSVVHAWHMPYAGIHPFVGDAYDSKLFVRAGNEVVDQALGEVAPPAELQIDRHVAHGSAAQALLDAGGEADLVVVGARGLGGFTGMVLGSVSQHVARHATCPVVVVPTGQGA